MTKGASAMFIMAVVLAVMSVAISAQELGMSPAMSPSEAETPSSQTGAAFSVPVSAAFVVSSLLFSVAAVFN